MRRNENNLNPNQEKFCEAFVSRDFFGNGTQSYLEVYGQKDENGRTIKYDTAKANAYRLLTNPDIIARINALLEDGGWNDLNVDKQHLFLINQDADLKTKMSAIREYNLLKKRIDSPTVPSMNIIFSNDQLERIAKGILDGNTGSKKEADTV